MGFSMAARRRYARQVFTVNVISSRFPGNIIAMAGVNIIFSKEDATCINPHDKDPLVITVEHGNWNIG